jgi:apoptosis-inducing factor 2
MVTTVVVVGGGYGGTVVAKALDDVADVVLVEPRDAFVHNVAALRGLVDLDWTDRFFLGYDRLLERGRVVRDRAVEVDGTSVTTESGQRIPADYIVLATGSTYPFPAKTNVADSAVAKARIRATHETLAQADRVLLLGAGAVGLELAGEITAAWADKAVTIVDPADDIMSGAYPAEFRAELRRQLDAIGVRLLLGTSLTSEPPSGEGEGGTFTVTTKSGDEITADIWFRCYGVTPVADYLVGELADAVRQTGGIAVTPELRLPGQDRVFALGDVAATTAGKTAKTAAEHAEVVAANIRTLIEGGTTLAAYEPGPEGIVLPLGPRRGASYAAGRGILDAAMTSQIKGEHMMIDRFSQLLGLLPAPAAPSH